MKYTILLTALLWAGISHAQIAYFSTGVPGAKDYECIGFMPSGRITIFTGAKKTETNLRIVSFNPDYPDCFIATSDAGLQYVCCIGQSHIELHGITKPYRKIFAFEPLDCQLCDKTPAAAMQHARAYTIGNNQRNSTSAERFDKVWKLAKILISIGSKL